MRECIATQFRIQIKIPFESRGNCKGKEKSNMNRKESVTETDFRRICGLC